MVYASVRTRIENYALFILQQIDIIIEKIL